MVHLVDNPERTPISKVRLTGGQVRDMTKAFTQMLAVTVTDIPEKVKSLLEQYGSIISANYSEEELISAIIEKVAEQDQEFNFELEGLILIAIPELQSISGYDNFLSGGSLFGGGSSGSSLLDGAKKVGTSTASGAVGGGIVGAALGAVGGIFNFATSAKQEKIEKNKASAMTLSSMMQYKSAKLGSQGSSQRTTTAIIIAIITLVGVIVTVVLIQKTKKGNNG
jgi:hypothetical protein